MGRFLAKLALLGVVSAGCRAQPYVQAHIETLNAEYRQLEDYIYALEEENARLRAELEAAQSRRTTGPGSPARGLFRQRPGTPPSSGGDRKSFSGDDGSGDLELPKIEIPASSTHPAAAKDRSIAASTSWEEEFGEAGVAVARHPSAPTGSAHSHEPFEDTPPRIRIPYTPDQGDPSAGTPAPVAAVESNLITSQKTSEREAGSIRNLSGSKGRPARIVLDPQHSRGADWDGRPGDDGLQLVIQGRTSDSAEAAVEGKLAIVVLDPARQGPAARLARWDFDRAATAHLVAASPASVGGLKLELPWPGEPPASNRLVVFVRLELEDGQRLETHRELYVIPPGQQVGGWTPRARRLETSGSQVEGGVLPAGYRDDDTAGGMPSKTQKDAEEGLEPVAEPLPAWSPTR